MKQKHLYGAHRWIAAIGGLQLLLWCAGGFVFATHDIEHVRGADGRRADAVTPVPLTDVHVSPAALVAAEDSPVREVLLRTLLGAPVYEVRYEDGAKALYDAAGGGRLPALSREAAVAVARRDREGAPAVISATLLERDPEVEYRGRPLPAWRVVLADDDGTHVYVDATTGVVTARRNDAWRRFDFFWMLHTMDYGGRDDFNTPWLIAFSLLGLLTGISGVVLWGLRLVRRVRARRQGKSAR